MQVEDADEGYEIENYESELLGQVVREYLPSVRLIEQKRVPHPACQVTDRKSHKCHDEHIFFSTKDWWVLICCLDQGSQFAHKSDDCDKQNPEQCKEAPAIHYVSRLQESFTLMVIKSDLIVSVEDDETSQVAINYQLQKYATAVHFGLHPKAILLHLPVWVLQIAVWAFLCKLEELEMACLVVDSEHELRDQPGLKQA